MRTSENFLKVSKALSKFQEEITNPINTKTNTFLKNKYAPLDVVLNTVRPVLSKNGLCIFQDAQRDEDTGKISVVTTLFCEDQFIESSPLSAKPDKDTAQGIGAVVTYLRRYSLSAALGISSEDDIDGNESAKKPKNTKNPVDKKIDEIANIINDMLKKDKSVESEIVKLIKKHNINSKGVPSANYQSIKDISIADTIITELNKIKGDN